MDHLSILKTIAKIFYEENKDKLPLINSEKDSETSSKIDAISDNKISKTDLEKIKEDDVLEIMKIYFTNSSKGISIFENLSQMWKYYTSKFNFFDRASFFIILMIIIKIVKSPASLFDNFIKYGLFTGFTYILQLQSCKMKKQNKKERIYGRNTFEHIKELIGLGNSFSYVKVTFESGSAPYLAILDKYNVNYYNLSEPQEKKSKKITRLVKNDSLNFCKKFLERYEENLSEKSEKYIENLINQYASNLEINLALFESDLEFRELQDKFSKIFIKYLIAKFINENGEKPTSKEEIDSISIETFNNRKDKSPDNFDYQDIYYPDKDFEHISKQIYKFITEDYMSKSMILPVVVKINLENGESVRFLIHQRQQVLAARILNKSYTFSLIWEISIEEDTEEKMIESFKTFLGVT